MKETSEDNSQQNKQVNKHLAKLDSQKDNPKSSEPEYRLVPVQPWDSSAHGYNGYNADDEIDLVELLKTLWEERKTILSFTLAGALIGIVIGFLSPKMYTVTATLLPEYNSESTGGASSLLRQFGGLAGISGVPMNETSSIRPDLYPEIVQTLPFQLELMHQEFYIPEVDSMATLFTYLTEIKEEDGLTTLISWTIGLPGKTLSLFRRENKQSFEDRTAFKNSELDILQLSKDENSLVAFLNDNVSATIDNKSGIISLSVSMPDPMISASVGIYVIDQLTLYLTEYRTTKVKRDLEFTENRLNEAKARYESAGLTLSEFQETQSGTATARIRKGEQFLQSEYEIAFGIYNTLSQQLEQQKLKVQEETPVFKILQPVNIPINPSVPKKMIIAVISTMAAVFISMLVVFIKRSIFRDLSQVTPP